MKSIMPFFSIIIPIFNSEKYITECMDSVVNQKFKDYEIIIVDDGSTDKSVDIVSRYVKDNSNIILLQQKNKGVSLARNTALKRATGKYIAFMDSDDYLRGESLTYLKGILLRNDDPDILLFNYSYVFPSRIQNHYLAPEFLGNSISKDVAIKSILSSMGGYLGYCWNKIYKRSFLKDKKFDGNIAYLEDMLFNVSLVMQSNSIIGIEDHLYGYRWRKDSMVNTFNSKSMSFFVALDKIESTVPSQFKPLINVRRKMACIEFASSLIFKNKNEYIKLKRKYKEQDKVKNWNRFKLSKTERVSLYLAGFSFDISVIVFKFKHKLKQSLIMK